MKFAKLFETKDGEQVLATIDNNPDRDELILNVTTDIEGIRLKLSLVGRPGEEGRIATLRQFSTLNQDIAEGLRLTLVDNFKAETH